MTNLFKDPVCKNYYSMLGSTSSKFQHTGPFKSIKHTSSNLSCQLFFSLSSAQQLGITEAVIDSEILVCQRGSVWYPPICLKGNCESENEILSLRDKIMQELKYWNRITIKCNTVVDWAAVMVRWINCDVDKLFTGNDTILDRQNTNTPWWLRTF